MGRWERKRKEQTSEAYICECLCMFVYNNHYKHHQRRNKWWKRWMLLLLSSYYDVSLMSLPLRHISFGCLCLQNSQENEKVSSSSRQWLVVNVLFLVKILGRESSDAFNGILTLKCVCTSSFRQQEGYAKSCLFFFEGNTKREEVAVLHFRVSFLFVPSSSSSMLLIPLETEIREYNIRAYASHVLSCFALCVNFVFFVPV